MGIISPPISKNKSFIEISKFRITWNLCLLFVPLLLLLFILHFLSSDPDSILSASAFFSSLFCLYILKRKREYKIVASIIAGFGSLLVQLGLFITADTPLMVTVSWIMLLVIISYYLLSKIWGTIFLAVNMIGVFCYIIFTENASPLYENLIPTTSTNIKALVNLTIITSIIAFLIYNFIKTIETATQELSQSNKKLKAQNQEKEVLLKEIHHRVKNNLQLIISMLGLQSSEIKDEAILSPFKEANNRIRSMALIHEKMYHTTNLAHIDIKSYLNELTSEIIYTSENKVIINTEIISNVIQTEIKTLVPLALIINELVTNSIKHAFQDQKEALISVFIEKKSDILFVNYKDNGSGGAIPTDKGIGSKLVNALTSQLNGKYDIIEDNGTLYQFQFLINSDDNSWITE